MTRIIAGSARGRRLAVPPKGTRPTSDRVREAMFSTIESELTAVGRAWAQVEVLDLFAGTGALGLEALSRGAAGAVLVEKSRIAAKVATANAETVGCAGARVIVRDVWQAAALTAPTGGVGLCLVDPPYEWACSDIRLLLSGLADAGWLAAGSIVVVERPAKVPESPLPESWPDARRRAYGDTVLWYGRFEAR